MDHQEHQKTLAYIIDRDFNILFSNNEMTAAVSEAHKGQRCFEIFGGQDAPCQECPLNGNHTGKNILFDHFRGSWSNITSAPIEIPCVGTCHVVINDGIDNGSEYFLYNSAGKPDYAELLELDYLNDTYKIAYQGEWTSKKGAQQGSISAQIRRVAETSVHPEDRTKFCEFWLIDQVGQERLPHQLHATRHGEFRKLRPEGGYDWVQEILLPIHQASSNRILVNHFYNIIGTPNLRHDVAVETLNTKLYNRDEFFRQVEIRLPLLNRKWCMIAIDVERLKLFNDWYGRAAGDALLKGVCDYLQKFQNDLDQIASYFYDDDFAVLMPYDDKAIQEFCEAVSAQMKHHSEKMNILPAFGVYEITDPALPVFTMYDRAKLACSSVKGNYSNRVKFFDKAMLEQIQSEYLLLSDVQRAFQNKEFTFYLQPKCSIETGKVVGAEALARWCSAENSMVSPGIFVPFLEKSGLISELDTYIWEEVCKWQRSMLDRGFDTVPVSVNVSRIDIYSVDVADYFQNLVRKYDLPPALIEIEITESAYAEDAQAISRIVKKFHDIGFRVSMDDFGSAYSSLNMLKDIDVDTLKIDMRFLDFSDANAVRGANILETVCHMARLLGLEIVAEGVETVPQKDLLLKAGCNTAQGFYFFRPLPIGEFENTVAAPGAMDTKAPPRAQNELFLLKDLMIQNAFSLNMLDNIIGAMAFYDVQGDNISIIRYNEQYAALFGDKTTQVDINLHFGQQLYQAEYQQIFQMFKNARENITTGSELDLRRRRADGTDIWIHMKMFYLYQRNGHDIFYSTVRDVTTLRKNNEVLQFLNNDMPGGYYRHLNNSDCDFTHISQRFLDLFGYTRQEIRDLFDDKFINMVHPADRQTVRDSIAAMMKTGGNFTQPCRMMSKNGYIYVLDQSRLIMHEDRQIFQGIILCDFDQFAPVNEENSANYNGAITALMPCGFFQSEVDGDHQFSYISDSFLLMLGYSRAEFLKKFGNSVENLVYAEDRKALDKEIAQQIRQSNFVSCEYRIEMADGSLRWVYSRARMTTDRNGKRWFNSCITDYDYLKKKYEVEAWQYLKYQSLSLVPGLVVFDYDPVTDRMTIEQTLKSGKKKTVVVEAYLKNIERHGFVAKECVEDQKKMLRRISQTPGTGATEFRGRFSKNLPYRWYRFHYNALSDERGRVYRVVGRSDDIDAEVEATRQAAKDSLTGLFNYETAKNLTSDLLQKKKGGTLILLDIDNFKTINDTYGHLNGDRVLKLFSSALLTGIRKKGVVSRFGGDEFMVFLPGLSDRRKAELLAQKILIAAGKIQVSTNKQLSCSIGITQVEGDENTPFDTLFRQADVALYQSKGNGKSRCTFYSDEMEDLIFLR